MTSEKMKPKATGRAASRSLGQVEWHGGDDDPLVRDERRAQACGDAVVKDPLPALGDHDLGHDERERHVRALTVQRGDVIGQRRNGCAIWGDEHLQRQATVLSLPRMSGSVAQNALFRSPFIHRQ